MSSPVLQVWLSGEWNRLWGLRDELAGTDGIHLTTAVTRADVVLHAAGPDGHHDAVAAVQELVDAPVVLLATEAAPELLEQTLAAQTADVLILPQSAQAVVFAARRAAAAAERQRTERPRGRIVTTFSPKGGTGKSVVSCNLAVTLARLGRRTLIVDCDLQFGDVAIMLGQEPERTIFDLVSTPGSLDADLISGYATRHRSGLDIMPAPLKPQEADAVGEARLVELLDAARHGYDMVVVDTAPFFDSAVLAAVDRTDELLMLCTPDVPTLKNVRLALETLELLSFPEDRVRVVLNRDAARIGFNPDRIAAVLGREVTFELPDDPSVALAVNRGIAAVDFLSQSPFSQAMARVADRLTAGTPAPEAKRGLRLAFGRRS